MKNLIGYIFGLALCAFFINPHSILTCQCSDPLIHSGNMFSFALFLLGSLASFCGIVAEAFKLISKINLHNSEIK